MVKRASRDLFGGHIGRRSHDDARLRETGGSLPRAVGGLGAHIFGQTKIENLDPAFSRHHHIGGLQVAMYDAFLVRSGQRLGQRAGNLDDAFDWQAIRRDQPIQRLSLDQFHGEKVAAVGFVHRIQRYNIRMVECGDRASLALEPGQSFGIAGNIRRQDLERYVAPQLRIGRAIHLTHSARANCGVDPVVCKCTSDQTEPPRVATHQLFVPEPRQRSYTKAAPSGLLPSHGQTEMYGPPRCRRRKTKVTGWSAQMYSAFVEHKLLALDGMRSSYLVRQPWKAFSGLQVSRA